MSSVKLSVTHRGRLRRKFGAAGLASIDQAVADWIAADAARGLTTLQVAIDDAAAMQPFGVPALSGTVTAQKVKTTLDALVAKISPDYIVLFGSGEILPHFTVANPSLQPTGDTDPNVPTDNPYACSRPYEPKKRQSYLIPDRVVGRIPDLPGQKDPAWLIGYLEAATAWKQAKATDFDADLFVCCDAWKAAGDECVRLLSRKKERLLLSPPSVDEDTKLRGRHAARLQMIKCHGGSLNASFYGQQGNDFPVVLVSTSLDKRVTQGSVVGAMCCFGAALFDPDDPAAVLPGKPPIPSVYLRQGAYGFAGSTTTAWVGVGSMLCADWVITSFLRSTLGGASLGRAFLDAKQELVRWIQGRGRTPDLPEEKTLLQFCLLGDPSIHPLPDPAASPVPAGFGLAAVGVGAAGAAGAGGGQARKARRAFRFELGDQLREALPKRTKVAGSAAGDEKARDLSSLAEELASQLGDLKEFGFDFDKPLVQQVERPVSRPELAGPRPRRGLSLAAVPAGPVVRQESLEYYWSARKDAGPVPEIRLVKVETDRQGNVLSTLALASS